MLQTLENQTTALAGLFLSSELVHAMANTGECDQDDLRTLLGSLFTLDTESVESVYGDSAGLRNGWQRLITQLAASDGKPELPITHYALCLLKIDTRLRNRQSELNTIRRGIEASEQLTQHFDLLDQRVIESLAGIYSKTISTIPPRIIVRGSQEYLKNAELAATIRAVLLAGVRSCVLWRC